MKIPFLFALALWLPFWVAGGELLSPTGWLERGEGAVRPVPGGGNGLTMILDFARDDRQLVARLPLERDLSDATSFRLRLDVDSPRTLLETTLDFRSGKGGYRVPFTLHRAGPTHVLLPKAEFVSHGRPAGWDRITEVRLTFWPRDTGRTTLRNLRMEAREDRVWIVDPEPLARTADEIYTSRVTVRHLGRVLSELGLPHGRVPIDALSRPEDAAILVFPYLPRVPEGLVDRLRSASRAGTKLVVFESESPELARLLQVELETAIHSHTVGDFNRLRFRSTDWIHPPDQVYQHAWTMRRLRPVGDGFPLAAWEDARERSIGQVAAVLSPKGAWFNVAWRSGDLGAKAEAVRALVGYLSPWTLMDSARFHRDTRSPEAFQRRHPDFRPAPAASATMWKRAAALHRAGTARLADGDPRKALRAYRASWRHQEKAYAASRSRWRPEIRGIWDQQGTGFRAGAWEETCRELARNGFNAVFANMATAGRAHYPSAHIPASKTLERHGDQLAAFSAAARAHDLQAHAWKICWKLNTRDPAFRARMEREERLMATAEGKVLPWLSLSDPRNVRHEIDSILEMLHAAPLDGIHLDYMRYPGREADYGPAARKAFEQRIGKPMPDWPREVLGPFKTEFQRFRQNEVHRAVQRISEEVRAEFPRVTLSVAVWGAWPDCADAQAQDWPVWARNGWVDWLVPMNYTDNPHQFEGWLDLQRAQPGVAERLLPGVGLISGNAELGPVALLDQLRRIRERDMKGFVLYRLDSSLPRRIFPYLRSGIGSN